MNSIIISCRQILSNNNDANKENNKNNIYYEKMVLLLYIFLVVCDLQELRVILKYDVLCDVYLLIK